MKGENYKNIKHENCEYFPCHNVENSEDFNCLFCYCPLYTLGSACGGNFKYINDVKDCSNCYIPHKVGGYEYIINRFEQIKKLAYKNK